MSMVTGKDGVSSGVVIVDDMEHKTHRGSAYFVEIDELVVANGATIWLVGKTQDQIIHMRARLVEAFNDATSPNTSVKITLHEGITLTDLPENVGTLVPSYNLNRNIDNGNEFLIYTGVLPASVTGEGTRLPGTNHFTGVSKQVISKSAISEYMMKKNTLYGLKIVNTGQELSLHFIWNYYQEDEEEI